MVKDLEAEFTPLFNLPLDFKYLVKRGENLLNWKKRIKKMRKRMFLGDENKEDKVNAVLPSTQASQPGSSTGGETQPHPSPHEVDLHEIRSHTVH